MIIEHLGPVEAAFAVALTSSRPAPTRPKAPPPPGMATLADLSARLPHRHGGSIEILLAAAVPFHDAFAPLRPLWSQEAMHRAVGMLRLSAMLRRRDHGRSSRCCPYERRIALHLAAELASLDTVQPAPVHPASGPLREIARDLVALFGQAIGHVELQTDVMRLSLPAYRRRALVLLGGELVTNALTHAFMGRRGGRISLGLHQVGTADIRLQVSDDGIGYSDARPKPGESMAGALTDLLAGEVRYFGSPAWGSIADIVFPIDA